MAFAVVLATAATGLSQTGPIPLPAMKPPPPGSEPSAEEKAKAPEGASPVAPEPMRPSDRGQLLSLRFKPGEVALDGDIRAKLASVAAQAKSGERRIQINAFAGGGKISASEIRRTSLKRALAVRTYLIEEGVRSTRIDVRALGTPPDDGPQDRVDLILLEN